MMFEDMIKEILLPDLGEGIETVDVSEVLVSPGDNITPGDIILVLESEKASMEIPSEEKGKIQKVFVTAGDQIKAGEILIIMDIVGDTLNKKEIKKQEIEPKQEQEKAIFQSVKTEKKLAGNCTYRQRAQHWWYSCWNAH